MDYLDYLDYYFLLLLHGKVVCLVNLWGFPPRMYGKILVDFIYLFILFQMI